jgi:hypothetical protein
MNKSLSKLLKDTKDVGNFEALLYHKKDTITYYYMICLIIRFGLCENNKIPYSDNIIIAGREIQYPRFDNKGVSKNDVSNIFDDQTQEAEVSSEDDECIAEFESKFGEY